MKNLKIIAEQLSPLINSSKNRQMEILNNRRGNAIDKPDKVIAKPSNLYIFKFITDFL